MWIRSESTSPVCEIGKTGAELRGQYFYAQLRPFEGGIFRRVTESRDVVVLKTHERSEGTFQRRSGNACCAHFCDFSGQILCSFLLMTFKRTAILVRRINVFSCRRKRQSGLPTSFRENGTFRPNVIKSIVKEKVVLPKNYFL